MILLNLAQRTEVCHAAYCGKFAIVGKTRCSHHQKMLNDQIVKTTERKKSHIARGICASCTSPLATSSVCYCEKHLDKSNQKSKQDRNKRRVEGFCHSCPRPVVPGYLCCEKHREKYRGAANKRQTKRRLQGFCSVEGCSEPPIGERNHCVRHLEQRRAHAADKRNGLTRSDVCYACGAPTSDGFGRCDSCKNRNAESSRELKEKRKQAGLCIHCGGQADQAVRRTRLSCEKCRRRMNMYSATTKNRFGRARRTSGKKKGWTITLEEYSKLIAEPCAYCKLPNTETYGTGLDRLHNDRGYHLDNVVSCCPECNIVRNSIFTPDEMMLLGAVIRQIKLTRTVKFQPNLRDPS